uniref:SGT1 protein n=2 Tax=Macrostomum lignano TaxID=282301 RepID=A0A1I8G7F3_9PLAT
MTDSTEQQQPTRPRIDWYQTDAYISISVFVKGVVNDNTASGVIGNDGCEFSLSYTAPTGSAGDPASLSSSCLKLNLAHPVAGDSLQLSVKPTRLDIRVNKQQPGLRWGVLEGSDSSLQATLASPQAQSGQPAPPVEQKPPQQGKNWDAIAKSIEDEKLEGDAALNDLFQKIYSDGTDEQRKAMVKSFTESGGTVLSTNWQDVNKGKVEVKPPDGMEYKKWDS